MSKLSSGYVMKLKKSLKMAVGSSSISSSRNCNGWGIDQDFYLVNPEVVAVNKSISFLNENREIERARKLFDEMINRTVVTWNTMITGYSKWNMLSEALDLISLAHHGNVKFNETTFSMSLSICGRAQSLSPGNQVHALVLKYGHERFKFVGSALLYLYGSCYEIEDGKRVFDELYKQNELLWSLMLVAYVQSNLLSEALTFFEIIPNRGVVEWSKLISGFVNSEDGCDKAMKLFKMMRVSNEAVPNEFTLDCVIRACGRLADLWGGRVVHGFTIKLSFEFDHFIISSLIFFYSCCEVMDDAMRIYDRIRNPSLDDSNELIGEFVMLGQTKKAELIFSRITKPNPVSYNLMIKAYAMSDQFEDSERLFLQMPVKILTTLNTMISVYARNGQIKKAVELFEKAKEDGGSVTWNSMISGYIENDQHEDAIKLYLIMLKSTISQTRSTFSAVFRACSCLGSLQQGRLLHAHLEKTPFPSNLYVGTSLLDMYSKCGCIADALMAFRCISSPNVVAWTALINGCAHHGLGLDAASFFNLMTKRGISPNATTFAAVLSACAHAGLLDEGMGFFLSMQEQYDVTPTLEHFTCIVDLLGRSGHLREAEKFITALPIDADNILLISFLNSCWFWMDMEVGVRVAEKIFALEPNLTSPCVILSNMYSRLGKWGEKLNVRKLLRELGTKKVPGCSWIDVNNSVHLFSIDDRNLVNCNLIACLESLRKNAHVPMF